LWDTVRVFLAFEPDREIVERDVQRRRQLSERAEAAGFAPGFNLAQIARSEIGGGERLACKPPINTPNAGPVLPGAKPAYSARVSVTVSVVSLIDIPPVVIGRPNSSS
jgi:hypothetical protein